MLLPLLGRIGAKEAALETEKMGVA